jgi:methylglutamate dehydrogenase subunit D
MTTPDFTDRSPLQGLLAAAGSGRGVIVTDRSGIALASVQARRGQAQALRARVREAFGIDLPNSPGTATSGPTTFVGAGPETWWAMGDLGALRQALGNLAAVVDQSDAYAIVRVTGPSVRGALAKLVLIDLHPDAFRPGDAASTVAAHAGLTLWRVEDSQDGAVFELACYRSFAVDMWHAFVSAGPEFGLTSEPQPKA